MNIYKYNRQKNLTVFSCWSLICLVLTVAYIGEVLKGNRTFEYFVSFSMFTWLPLVISYGHSLILGRGDLNVKHTIAISYLIFYAYTQITSQSSLTFVYIMPMICVLIVYDDIKLIDRVCIVSLIINIFYVTHRIQYFENEVTPEMITFYEIQFACLFLCTIFIHGATRVITYGNDKLERLNEEIAVDELTSAYNRYYLNKLLKDMDFKDEEVSLAIIDLDNFKKINDTYGHKFGDLVLRKISSITRDCTDRYKNTHFVRIGGDEFVILSTALTKDEMYATSNEICDKVSKARLNYGDEAVGFTISMGVASSVDDKAYSYSRLYETADAALYRVKHSGKSSVAKATAI